MTKSECRKLVREHLLNLMRAIGVSGWRVDVLYGEISNESAPRGFSNQMESDVNYRYEKALITINHDVIENREDFIQGLRHELIHVALSPMNAYDKHIREYVGEQPSNTWDAINDAWHEHLERTVLNIERILDWGLGQTPLKLAATAQRRWGDPEVKPKKKKKRRKR